jgi:hypothetical protein
MGWAAGYSAAGVTSGGLGGDASGSKKARSDEADQDGSDWAGAGWAASGAVSVWRAGAFPTFMGRAFGGCLCHTRAVTKMSSFSENGAIRHQARGSAT